MFFNGRKDILEFHDLVSLHGLELVVENGVQYVSALFRLNPERPPFEGDEKPNLVLLTNGSSTHMFGVEPKPEAPVAAEAVPAAAPVNVYLSTQNGPEASVPAPAAPEPQPEAPVEPAAPEPQSEAPVEPAEPAAPEPAPEPVPDPQPEQPVEPAPEPAPSPESAPTEEGIVDSPKEQ